MTEAMAGDDRRARVLRLLQFLHELIRAKSTVIRNVDDHQAVVWLGDEWNLPVRAGVTPGGLLCEVRSDGPAGDAFVALAGMIDDLAEQPESLDVVLAAGLLTVSDPDAPESEPSITEHLLTQKVVAEHDYTDGVIRIRLAGDSTPRLNDSHLLSGVAGFDLTESAAIAERVATLPSVLVPEIGDALAAWTSAVTGDSDRVGVQIRPALVLRDRGSSAILTYYETMMEALRDSTVEVPIGLAQLVEPIESPERLASLSAVGAMSAEELVEDALYPLPSNVEQRDILAQLGSDSGVVVEGPPGTGKTHTIANLTSALLAKGQRVLVVSEKAQALQVLRDKLPPDLRELAVAVTDVTKDGSVSLAQGVEAISRRKSTFQPRVATSEIKNLRSKRDQARAKREQTLREIWQLRESETEKHEWVAAGFSGTAAQIVRACQASRDQYDWLPGPVESALPPMDSDEMERLLSLLRERDETWAPRLGQRLPDLESLLPGSVELEAICTRVRAQPTERMTGSGSLLAILSDVDSTRLIEIKAQCERLTGAVREVRSLDQHMQDMAERLLSGEAAYLWNRITQISSVIDDATQRDQAVGTVDVVVSDPPAGAASVYEDAAEHVRAGGVWRARFRKSAQQRAVENLGVTATVDGRTPTTHEALQCVADHLAVLDDVRRVQTILSDVDVPVDTSGSRSAQLGRLVALDGHLASISELLTGRDALVRRLEAISPGGPRPKSVDDVDEVAQQTGAVAATNDAVLARRELDQCARNLAAEVDQGPSDEGNALVAAVIAADVDAIGDARRAWSAARAQQQRQGALDLLELRLKQKAPALHALLQESATDPIWDTRLHDLTDAWSWRRAYSWAQDRSDPGREARLAADLDAVEADIAQFTAGLAAACAWRECLEHMTVTQVQALQSYRDHIANLGKGSGKHAERFRRAARSAMGQAQGAVPAWIMPISQVLSSIAPEQNSFDVVIVDESSQADITSVFLLWLAPRVIVVGDDRQCAPGGFAGAGLDSVFAKLDSYLHDVPQYMRDSLTPRSSLFSMLRTRFGHVVRLREHFRSMPEIIEYSSRQFYPEAPLVPVRQFGADRLQPLQTVHVPDATATGDSSALTNQVEADALVSAVAQCVADPRYAGLHIGVVVLQGQRQVDLISQRLRAAIGTQEWHARSVRVGTPPDFQGDERNVVFLSMVVSRDRKPVSLTRSESQRRFNVAASRAMDQLWLFHSVSSDDLRHNDLRYSLTSYMERTQGALTEPMPTGVNTTERSAPFDSLFEQQIFVELADRGFHVNPKVSVNNRVIDLVVTGSDGRLAVECDGDEFTSTPEQARADMERERELRRCGWRFWRVRESEYLLDPERAMSGLWAELDERGVFPSTVSTVSAAEDDDQRDREPWEPIDLVGDD